VKKPEVILLMSTINQPDPSAAPWIPQTPDEQEQQDSDPEGEPSEDYNEGIELTTGSG
jgi:hypothetical protein